MRYKPEYHSYHYDAEWKMGKYFIIHVKIRFQFLSVLFRREFEIWISIELDRKFHLEFDQINLLNKDFLIYTDMYT